MKKLEEIQKKIVELNKESKQFDVIYVLDMKDKSESNLSYKDLSTAINKQEEYKTISNGVLCYTFSHKL